jgi:predicted ATPase
MGPCQVQVLGPASDEMLETYATAVQLCEKHGTLEQRFKALWGLWFYHFMLGDVLRMRDLANQLIPLARELGDEALELEGHHCEWAALSLLGDLEGALTSTEIGIEKYRQDQHHWMTFHYGGHDPGLCAHSLNAVNLCLLGYPDRAKTVMSDALNFADRLNHSYSLLETKFCALTVMLLCSDHAGIRQHAGELIELTDANRLPSEARALANGFLGWVQTETGEVASGLSLMKASVSDWQAFWGAWCFPLDAAYAAALTDQGECEAALGLLDAATEVGGSTGGHWWDAEFLRVRGKALLGLQSSDTSEVRTSLDAALAAARKREARLFELRAATDLANLILDEGDASAAKVLLEPVVQSMPQGHDLLDIIVAHKTLGRCLNDHSRTE